MAIPEDGGLKVKNKQKVTKESQLIAHKEIAKVDNAGERSTQWLQV